MAVQLGFGLDVEVVDQFPPEKQYVENPVFLPEDTKHLHNFTMLWNPSGVPEFMDWFAGVDEYAFDLETTGLRWETSSIHGIAFASADREWYLYGDALLHALASGLKDLMNRNITAYAHNAKFDLHFLRRHGIRPPKVFDTMLAWALIDENLELKLKLLSLTQLGITDKQPQYEDLLKEVKRQHARFKRLDDIPIYAIPIEKLAPYAARDTRFTFDLAHLAIQRLEQEKQTAIFWETEMPFMYVLLDMEAEGVTVDLDYMEYLKEEFSKNITESVAAWNSTTGGVYYNSTQKVGEYLFGELGLKPELFTGSGAPKVDVQHLNRLKRHDSSGAISSLLEIRKWEKLISTYLSKLAEIHVDGKVYGSLNQTGAVTWRLSSSDPNLQNIPSRGEAGAQMRRLFVAPPGHDMIVCDLSQIELRLLAHYTMDANLLRVFADDGDPHQLTADLLGIERKYAKNVNFGWTYGMGARGLADFIEKITGERPSERDTKAWLEKFEVAYPTVINWKNEVLKYAKKFGYVWTLDGHRRRLPGLKSSIPSERGRAERQAVNSIIQGSAATVIKRSMLRIANYLPMYDAHMLLQVHDELVFVAPKEYSSTLATAVQRDMIEPGEFYGLRVKLKADPGIGDNWYEAK